MRSSSDETIPDKNETIPDKNETIPDKNETIPDENEPISKLSNVLQERRMVGESYIPVLLTNSIGNFRFSSVLRECLHLKGAPVESYIEVTQVNFHL